METKKRRMSLRTLCIISGSIAVILFVVSNIVVKLPYTITDYFNLYDLNSLGIAFAAVAATIWVLVSEKLLKWSDKVPWW